MKNAADLRMPDLCSRRYPFHYTTALNLLMRMGIDLDRVDILAAGWYKNYRGEVREQQPAPGAEIGPDTRIRLEVGYSSAVDYMPHQFFSGLRGRSAGNEWERKAREAMAPFDAAVVRHEALARYMDIMYNFAVLEEDYIQGYLKLFDFDAQRETGAAQDAAFWAALLPTFHEWAGNPRPVEKILQAIFGYRFDIIENIASTHPIPDDLQYRLGSKTGRVGCESILGSSFSECDSAYGVRIRDIPRDEITAFLPGGHKRKRLEKILQICMPSHLNYRLFLVARERRAKIGRREKTAFLGYATRL